MSYKELTKAHGEQERKKKLDGHLQGTTNLHSFRYMSLTINAEQRLPLRKEQQGCKKTTEPVQLSKMIISHYIQLNAPKIRILLQKIKKKIKIETLKADSPHTLPCS